jgi:hypothetical protein
MSGRTGHDVAMLLREGDSAAWSGLRPGWASGVAEALEVLRCESWDPELVLYGDVAATYLEEVVLGEALAEVEVGLDVRTLQKATCSRLAESLRVLRAVLVSADGILVVADAVAIADAVRRSPAWMFVTNPEEFLKSIGTGNVGP